MELSEAKILVVDDEPALLHIFSKWLKTIGCGAVSTATDGVDALGKLDPSVDLLITDVRMPRMDGVSLVRGLGQRERSLPSIVFVSGFGDVDEREMYGLGVEAFLAKPLRLEELADVIRKALALRTALWQKPMEAAPRQTIQLEVERMGASAEGCGNALCVGHGGFSVRYPGPVTLGKVAFQCRSTGVGTELKGHGLVRWRSRVDQTIGVEFSYLEEAGRRWVLDEIAQSNPRCFIPGSFAGGLPGPAGREAGAAQRAAG